MSAAPTLNLFSEQDHDAVALLHAIERKQYYVYPVGPEHPLQERIRRCISENKFDWTVYAKGPDGKVETFGQAFERVFGEPLQPTKRKGK